MSTTRLLLISLLFLLLAACSRQQAPAPEPKQAAEVPPPPARTAVKAEEIRGLLTAARGKVVVLNLWATWCPPCVAEMPHFVEFFKEADPAKVVFISLSADDVKGMDTTLKQFQEEHCLPFNVYVMNDTLEATMAALNVELSGSLPTTVVYSKAGEVLKMWERAIKPSDLDPVLRAALAAGAPVPAGNTSPPAMPETQ
ncbi:MAG: TlpA family protein disulfide reductase [Candidatus Hydrogenedentes bacterium]|nr:TlpA family protein disulfide reductase [Candidatus Hydrogenedentota bacterium]